ncbi:unnamed protein product [Linum trigynum]
MVEEGNRVWGRDLEVLVKKRDRVLGFEIDVENLRLDFCGSRFSIVIAVGDDGRLLMGQKILLGALTIDEKEEQTAISVFFWIQSSETLQKDTLF